MISFVALLRREWYEHRFAFLLSPGVLLVLVMLAGMVFLPSADEVQMSSSERMEMMDRLQPDEDGEMSFGTIITAMVLDVAGSSDAEISQRLRFLLNTIAVPFYWVLLFVSVFGLVACVYDERRDRSVLFWKSMPVSDTRTILSKYVYVAWAMPLLTAVFVFVAQFYAILLFSAYVEDGMGGRVWANSGLLITVLQLVVGFALNGVVLLPVYGWILLVSAAARSAPFLWVLGVPLTLSILEGIFFDSGVFAKLVGWHLAMPTLPRASYDEDAPGIGFDLPTLAGQFEVLSTANFWLGALVGAGLLAATVRVRGRTNEI